jgi:hypothetical protein
MTQIFSGMNCRSSVLEIVFFMVRFLELMRTRNGRKRPLLTSETAAFAGDFVREFSLSRASAKNPVLSQATVVIFYPVGRPPLSQQPFLMPS